MVFKKFLGDKYDVIAPHSETYIFSDTVLNWMYKNYDEIIIIYDFDLAGVMGVNRLRKRNLEKFSYTFISTERIRINGKIKIIDKDISDYVVGREEKEVMAFLESINL